MKKLCRILLRSLSVIAFAAAVYFSLAGLGYISLPSGIPDAVSKATGKTVTADDMTTGYVVLINRALHDKSGTTSDWERFFSFSDDVPLIMEDISCSVAKGDAQGLETARNFQQRLPENQMSVTQESGSFMISRAEAGKLDVIIMSSSQANSLAASTLYERDYILTVFSEDTDD